MWEQIYKHYNMSLHVMGKLAEAPAATCVAAEVAACQRMKSLRDCHFSVNGIVPSSELKLVQQLNGAYSLVRHLSDDQMRKRVEVLVAMLQGDQIERHSFEDFNTSSADE